MPKKRSYADPCGVARALDLVGERWALLVVRDLLLGPKRFTDLRVSLPHIGPDVLSQRLRELEEAGLVVRDTLAPPAASRVYRLTARGAALEPVVLELGRWGSQAPFPAAHGELSPDSLTLALKTTFSPVAAGSLALTVALNVDGQLFAIRVADGELALVRGTAERPDLTITAEAGALTRVLWHGQALDDAVRAGDISLLGARRDARRFLGVFVVPAGAGSS
jgi:DNA-binding HxlR family transcriptional regulator